MTKSAAPGHAAAAIVLIVAVAFCALLLWVGPIVAEALIGAVGGAEPSAVAMDSIFTLVLFGSLFLVALAGARLTGVKALRLGERPLSSAALGLGIGLAGVAIAAAYGWIAGALTQVPTTSSAGLLLAGSALVLLQAGSEEVYFRGWLQPVLTAAWGPAVAIVVSALAFGFLHTIGGAVRPVSVVNLFLGGVLFGLLTYYRGGIAAAVAAHFAWNWTELMLLGLVPNPGIGSFGAVTDLELAGAAIWGGSDEGLNASIAMTLVLAAFIVPLLLVGRRRDPEPIAAPTAPDRSGPAPA